MGANLLSSILCAPAFKMGILSRHLRVPRPRTFLYLMSLRTGVEMVSLSVIFNKLTGFFGLLAILTGVSLSPLQLSMYIYSAGAGWRGKLGRIMVMIGESYRKSRFMEQVAQN